MADTTIKIQLVDEGGPGAGSQTAPAVQARQQPASRQQGPSLVQFGQQMAGSAGFHLPGIVGQLSQIGNQLATFIRQTLSAAPLAQRTLSTKAAGAMAQPAVGAVAGQVAGGAAVQQAGGASAASTGSLASLVESAGPVVIAFAAVAAAVAGAVLAIKGFADMVRAQAQELQRYSPQVAMAAARTNIKETFQGFRRAEQIGPQVARFEDLRSDAMDKLYDVGTQIMKEILDFVGKFEPEIKTGIQLLGLIPPGIEVLAKPLEVIIEIMSGKWGEVPETLRQVMAANNKLGRAVVDFINREEARRPPQEDPWVGAAFRIMDERIAQDARPRPPAPPPPAPPPWNPPWGAAGAAAAGGGA